MAKETKLNYGKIILLGSGFLGISLLWAVYNAYVPIFLQAGNPGLPDAKNISGLVGFGLSAAATGFIMSLDNIAAVFIQPWIGVKSDATRTRFGRRMPYIMVGVPLTVAGFVAIPYAITLIPPELSGQFDQLTTPFLIFVVALGFTLLAAAIYRTPAIALMPDIAPSKFRSQANGIINLMGGFGVVTGLLAGGALFDINISLPFWIGGAVVLLTGIVLVAVIKEPRDYEEKPPEKNAKLMDTIKEVWRNENKSVLFLLLAIFAWFLAYNSLETFFTSYATFDLGITAGKASQLFTIAGATFILATVPSGYLAGKIGRKKTILIGLTGFTLAILAIFAIANLTTVMIAMGVVGVCWAMVNINSLPMVVDSVSQEKLGAYTGMYYFASMSAAIAGPIVIGQLIDILNAQAGIGYRTMFLVSAAAMGVAAIFLSRVSTGEAIPEPQDAEPTFR
ncbi:MAG TPA: SLC45 family MFS transporter [Chloroflexi bacterium]|nr:SLC45 family MFS transporter [Chloroflexota bacterium]